MTRQYQTEIFVLLKQCDYCYYPYFFLKGRIRIRFTSKVRSRSCFISQLDPAKVYPDPKTGLYLMMQPEDKVVDDDGVALEQLLHRQVAPRVREPHPLSARSNISGSKNAGVVSGSSE